MRRRFMGIGAVAALVLALGLPAPGAGQSAESKWVVDIVHSQIDFRVRHLVGRVRGTFTNWYAEIVAPGGDWQRGSVSVNVRTASLDTGNRFRDNDLRGTPFFAVDSFPTLTFEGRSIEAAENTLVIHGDLTLKGHTRPITLTGQYRGLARDTEGHERLAFEAAVTLDRRDFGMEWSGTVGHTDVIGNEVEISIALEAVRVR